MSDFRMELKLEDLRRDFELSLTIIAAILLAAEMGEPLTLSDAIDMLRKNAHATDGGPDGAAGEAMRVMSERFEVLRTNFERRCGSPEQH